MRLWPLLVLPQLSQETTLDWRSCTDAPMETAHAQVVAAGEKVYVGAGSTLNYYNSLKAFEYSVTNDSWSSLPACSVSCFAMAVFQERLITLGGLGHTNAPTAKVFSLSQNPPRWENTIPPMPTACSNLVAATTASAIIAAGGRTDGGWLHDGVAVYSSDTFQWYTAAPLPSPRASMSSTVIDSMLYLMAGRSEGDSISKDCICVSLPLLIQKATLLQPAANSTSLWRALPLTPLRDSSAACLMGLLVAMGGQNDDGACSTDVHVFIDDKWVQLSHASLPAARSCCAILQLAQDEVIVVGGYTSFYTCTHDTYIGKLTSNN